MSHCWEHRGCDEEMQSRCPHNRPGEPCPPDCRFAYCTRPRHKVATDINLLLTLDVDRNAATKEACRVCEYFLTHGPSPEEVQANGIPTFDGTVEEDEVDMTHFGMPPESEVEASLVATDTPVVEK